MNRCPHTALVAAEMESRGFRVEWLHRWCFVAERRGHVEVFWSTRSRLNSQIASVMCKRKDMGNRLLRTAGVSVPVGRSFGRREVEAAVRWAQDRWPVVVKPASSPGHGKGATVGIRSAAGLRRSWPKATAVFGRVLVQEQVPGVEARMLVIGGRCVSVLRKLPGETYEAITDRVHPTYVEAAERAVAAFPGLGLAGLDVIASDWFRPGPYAVIEVNAAPGIRGHHNPQRGPRFDAAGAIVDELLGPRGLR